MPFPPSPPFERALWSAASPAGGSRPAAGPGGVRRRRPERRDPPAGADGASAFAEALPKATQLATLDLDGNSIGAAGVAAIVFNGSLQFFADPAATLARSAAAKASPLRLLSLIHISEPTRQAESAYAVVCV